MNCILPRTARKTDFGTLCLLSCLLWMTAPMNEFVFWCGHSRDSNGYYYVTASWVPYHIHTTWCGHSPCTALGFSTPHDMIYSITILVTAKNKTKNTVRWLSSSRSDWHVLQRRCQPTPTPIYIYQYNVLQRRHPTLGVGTFIA